jgi:hypothetical protein
MKTFSDIIFSEEKTINNINSKEKIIFSLTNNNFGEKVFKKTRKNIEMDIEVNATSVNEVFIFSFFLSEVGRYLIKLFPSPKRLKLEINIIIEIRVVPIPTCSEEYRRAFIIQKKKPNTAITPVLNIR